MPQIQAQTAEKQDFKELTKEAFDFSYLLKRTSISDKAFMARQLATMLNSGLPLLQSMQTLVNQTKKGHLKEVLQDVVEKLGTGKSFTQAISGHPEVFDNYFVALAHSGEISGKLDKVLLDLADQLESNNKLISSIRGALYYPIFIVIAMVVVGIILMVRVIPSLTEIFKESGVALPLTTRILVGTSTFLIQYWYIAIITAIILIVAGRLFLISDFGIEIMDNLKIKVPIVKEAMQSIYMVNFTRNFSMLIKAGVPIVESLNIIAKIMGNVYYERTILDIARQVERGVPLSKPISESKLFPVVVTQMVKVGEETGRVDEILANLSNYFQMQTDTRLKGLLSLFEPAILVIIGLGVAIMVFAVLMPIYQIAQLE